MFLISLGAMGALAGAPLMASAKPPGGRRRIKISLDTSADHIRNKAIGHFAELLESRTNRAFKVSLFPSGQMSRDRDTPKSLHWELIDIAVPAISKLSRYDPYANLFTLPVFFGAPTQAVYDLIEGEIGQWLESRLEKSLKLKILGSPIDLGHTHVYTTSKKVTHDEELRGLKIRIPGGRGALALYKSLGANPVVIPFADLPIALSQGNVSAVQSTHETIRSGKLWEAGLQYCYEDHSSFLNYIPLVSTKFWKKISPDEQETITSTWNDSVKFTRELAATRQLEARAECEKNGIQMNVRLGSPSEKLMKQLIASTRYLGRVLNFEAGFLDKIIAHVGTYRSRNPS